MASRNLITEIPLGAGLNGSKNISQIPPQALIDALNITYESGTLEKEAGCTKYNSTAITGAPAIIAGHDWIHDGAAQRMIVVCDDGAIYKDSGGGTFADTLKTGLTVSSSYPTFVEGGQEAAANNRKLFIFTGQNAVQVLSADGASTADLTTPPTDWATGNPTGGFIHEGRLWGYGNTNDPHRLYYSTATDHEDFTSAGSGTIAISPGEGEGIMGAVPFNSLIVVFKKPRGVYLVDTSSPTIASWKVRRHALNIGLSGVRNYTQVENDVLFMDTSGDIRLLSAVQEYGDVGTQSLSDKSQMQDFLRDYVNMNQQAKFQMVYYKTKREVHLACCGTGSSVNNRRLVIDFNIPGISRFRFSDRDTAESIWLRKVNSVFELTTGDDSGFVWRLDQEARGKNGVGYNAQFQTPHMDLSHVDPRMATKRKNGKELELICEPSGNHNLSMDIYWDGDFSETVTFNMGSAGAVLGSFVLGTDALAGNNVLNKKRRIVGGGRRISLKGRNSGNGQNFSIARIFLHYTIDGERLD